MSRKILLADDSVTIQKVVELTFMDEDIEVVTFGDGAESLERLDEVAPDLVIADVHMPGADGYEVCRQTKSRRAGTPVLLLVGTFEPFDEIEAEACGSDGYLKKPFDSQDLLEKVEALLSSAGLAAAPAPVAAAPADVVAAGSESADTRPRPALAMEEPTPEPVAEAPSMEAASAPAAAEAPTPAAAPETNGGALDSATIDKIARRVAEILGESVLQEIAWEVVPDLAEVVIKERIRELESQVE